MPVLLATTPDQEPLVQIISKGYAITESGVKELDKRKIKHLDKMSLSPKTLIRKN